MKATPRAAEIPPATDELLAAGQRRLGEGRLNLRDLKPAGIDDASAERHVEEITQTYGAHVQIAPTKSSVAEPAKPVVTLEATSQPGAVRRSRYASFRVDLDWARPSPGAGSRRMRTGRTNRQSPAAFA